MKKVISLVLVALMLAAVFAFAGCNKTGDEGTTNAPETSEAATLKFGLGVSTVIDEPKNADGETNGTTKVNTTAVAVLLDAEGKIVDIKVDTLQAQADWTSEGVAAAATEVKTKYELGTDYNMAAFGKKHDGSEGKPLEWFEQIDAFVATAKGKTAAEVKAFAGEDAYAIGDLATAGCTIKVGEIMAAFDKAVAAAADSAATANDKLGLGFSTSVKNTDATEEKAGTVEVTATIVATVVNAEGKVVVAKTDAAQTKVTFDAAGASTVDMTAELKTKGELGTAYNMAAYGTKHDGSEGQPLEWDVQAAEFDKALVGKTAADFAAFADETGYATGDLATAGCTINVAEMIKAATKAVA